MSETEEKYGSLLFFRKNGKAGTTYTLSSGKIRIGHSTDADIRLKLKDERLEEIHCIIDVSHNGIATLLNKSSTAPVTVNSKPIRTFRVLCNRDKIDLVGKQFEYLNEKLSDQEIEKHQAVLNKVLSTPSKKRHSVAPMAKVQNSPNFKVKTSAKTPVQKRSLAKKSLNRNRTPALTPQSKFDGSQTVERPKTTSKLIVSKALGSPIRANTRRLSWDNNPNIIHRKPKVSARNILLPGNATSNSSDEEPVPSLFLEKGDSGEEENNSSLLQTEEKLAKDTSLSTRTPNKLELKTPIKTPRSVTPLLKSGKSNVTPVNGNLTNKKFKTPKNTPKRLSKALATPTTVEVVPVNAELNSSDSKVKTPKNTPKKLTKLLSTPATAGSSTRNKVKTPRSAATNNNHLESPKFLSTPIRIGTPTVTPTSNKLNVSENKLKSVPKNKRLELLKRTPISTKKSTPLKSSKTVEGTRASNNLDSFPEMGRTPKSSNIGKKSDVSSSLKRNLTETPGVQMTPKMYKPEVSDNIKKRTKSVGNRVSPVTSTSKRRKTEGNQPSDVFNWKTAKNLPSSGRKSKITSVDSGDLSEGSEALNLSVGSLISPIQPRKTLYSADSDIYEGQILNDPRLSLGKASPRKSIRKSRQTVKASPNGDEISSESTENASSRLSTLRNKEREEGVEEEGATDGSEKFVFEEAYRDSLNKSKSRRSSKQNGGDKSLSKPVERKSAAGRAKVQTAEGNSSDNSGFESSIDENWGNNFMEKQKGQDLSDSLEYSSFEEKYENMYNNKSKLGGSSNRFEGNRSSSRSRLSTRNSVKNDGEEQIGQSSSEESEDVNLLPRRSKTRNVNEQTFSYSNTPQSRIEHAEVQDMNASNSESSKKRRSFKTSLEQEKDQSDEYSVKRHSVSPRRSSRRNGEENVHVAPGSNQSESEESNVSSVKSLFVPQRRPSIKRSYVGTTTDKDLLICLSRPAEENIKRDSEYEEVNSSNSSISNRSDGPRRSLRRKSIGHHCKSCETSPVETPSRRVSSAKDSDTSSIFNQTASSENLSSLDSQSEDYTSNSKRTSETQSDEELREPEPLDISSKSNRASRNKVSSNDSYKTSSFSTLRLSDSVITVDDVSIKGTPENNTSIIILDTPFEKVRKVPQRKPSKTLNSSFEDDSELTTPKSAIKSRRSKSLPYQPIVEDVTPVTLQDQDEEEVTGFKTPINTPGLFENIKKSVLKSRSRRRPSSNLMEELNKADVKEAVKRPRESTGSVGRSAKKRKVGGDNTLKYLDEDLDASFSSFASDEIFSDMPDQSITPNTPQHFKNLTDKPLITDPQSKSLTEPRKQKTARNRLSLHAMRLESHFSESDKMSDINTTSLNSTDSSCDSNDVINESNKSRRLSRRLSLKAQKPPMSDVTNVRSPKNDLTDVRGVKRLMRTPRSTSSPNNMMNNMAKTFYPVRENSPENDLSDVAGVKKLLGTPIKVKSPKNDLRNVPNLRKLMSPKKQNSPRNDLSDVAGLKKLLGTPKKQNEPKNDLTNVAGVKKLLSTPKKQKSPKNDLTKVPNLRRMMSPRRQNSPVNDLTNVEGVADIFAVPEVHKTERAIENNENLFDKLFDKKPIRTYRGRSLSPITRKAMLFGGDQRKTLGDSPCSSPRIKKWLEDQAVIRLERVDSEENVKEKAIAENKHSQKKSGQVETVASPRIIRGRQGKAVEQTKIRSPMTNDGNDNTRTVSEFKSPLPAKRGRLRKASVKDDALEQIAEIHSTTEDIEPITVKRVKGREVSTGDEIESSDNEVTPVRTRIRPRVSDEEQSDSAEKKPAKRGRMALKKDILKNANTETEVLPKRRGRPRTVSHDEVSDSAEKKPTRGKKPSTKHELEPNDAEIKVISKQRGRPRTVSCDEVSDSTEKKPAKRGRKQPTKDELQSTDTETEALPKKPAKRGRKQATKDELENTNTEIEVVPKRGGRSRTASRDESFDTIGKKNNAQRKVQEEEGEDKSTPNEPFSNIRHRKRSMSCSEILDLVNRKPTRGRKAQRKEEDKNGDVEVKPLPKRRGRARSASCDDRATGVQEDAEDKITDVKAAAVPKRQGRTKAVPLEEPVVSTEQKRTRGRKAKLNEPEDDNMESKNETKKDLRRKNAKKVPEPTQEPLKKSRNNNVIEILEGSLKDDDKESPALETDKKKQPVRRGRKKAIEETEVTEVTKEEVVEKNGPKKRNQKSNSSPQEKEKPARKGGRRKIAVKETEDSVNEDDKENLEKIPQSKTRSRRGPAGTKIEETSEDSPRTMRQKRGNFKKYGNEFVTQTEEGDKAGKRVRFEDDEEKSSGKNKRGAKVAEEIEETVRRSKRTRK